MKVAIMQPYFLPYIGYFQLISSVDVFVVYDDVHYIKKGWINRNRTLSNNEASLFSIPLKKMSQNKLILELELHENKSWKEKFLKKIQHDYAKAPHFYSVFSLLDEILSYPNKTLSEYTYNSFLQTCYYLRIPLPVFKKSSSYGNQDLRAENRILDICKKEVATEYLNPIGGGRLYSKEKFQKNGIDLHFIKTGNIIYKQFMIDSFVANLSIIDMLMFCTIEEIHTHLKNYSYI